MLKTKKLVPSVYYNQSRDFQVFGRTYDVVFNYLKTLLDTIYSNPLGENSGDQYLDLVATTLGFKSKHHYNTQQLKSICNILSKSLRYKGTLQSIEWATDALLGAEGISDSAIIDLSEDHSTLSIYLPMGLKDTSLLKDLLTYLLPAGMSCEIIRQQSTTTQGLTNISPYTPITYLNSKQSWVTSVVPGKDKEGEAQPGTPTLVTSKGLGGLIDNSTIVGSTITADPTANPPKPAEVPIIPAAEEEND